MRIEMTARPILWLAGALLLLLVSGCQPSFLAGTSIPPTPIRITATLVPTFTATSTVTPTPTTTPTATATPVPTWTPFPTYTPFPSPTATSQVPAQPSSFLEYSSTIRRAASALEGNNTELEALLREWGAITNDIGTVQQADLTHDGDSELVINYVNPQAGTTAEANIVVLKPGDEEYRILFDTSLENIDQSRIRLLVADDINADGLNELAYTGETCRSNTCFTSVQVRRWNGTSFTNLFPNSPDMPAVDTVEFRNEDSDAANELVLVGGVVASEGAGPQRQRTEIWDWNGQTWQASESRLAPTDWMSLIAWEGHEDLSARDYGAAQALFNRVLTDDSLKTWHARARDERTLLRSFAAFELVVLHAAQGQPAQARSALERLRRDYEDSPFREAGERFYETWRTDQDLGSACDAVAAYASTQQTSLMQPLNDFGYSNPSFAPEDICPFTS